MDHGLVNFLQLFFHPIAPSLVINQSVEAESHVKCEDEKGFSRTWISGCKNGWHIGMFMV
jgi:hypothetical protein